MKLPLLCVFMGLGLVFADQILPEEPPTQMGVQKRGEAYNQCIEGYLSQAIADVSQDEDDTTQRAVEEAANTIRECLAAYTDAPAPERQESMLSCADGAYSNLIKAMEEGGKSPDDIDRVLGTLKEYQAKAMSSDPSIGCHDDA